MTAPPPRPRPSYVVCPSDSSEAAANRPKNHVRFYFALVLTFASGLIHLTQSGRPAIESFRRSGLSARRPAVLEPRNSRPRALKSDFARGGRSRVETPLDGTRRRRRGRDRHGWCPSGTRARGRSATATRSLQRSRRRYNYQSSHIRVASACKTLASRLEPKLKPLIPP